MPSIDWAKMWIPERSPLETVIRAAIVYVFVLASLRFLGRRELGQATAYSMVLLFFVAVAVRTTIVGSDPSVTTAMIGFGTLVALDAFGRWLSNVSSHAALVINGPVRSLVRDGHVDDEEMRRAHLSREQLLAALRAHGHERLVDVHQASLERSGDISFVFKSSAQPRTETH